MKRIYFLLLFMFFTFLLFSQAWLKNIPQNKPKGELILKDYTNAFNEYWAPYNVDNGYYLENGEKKKAIGWKQFKRWEYYMESQINPTTGEFPKKTAQAIYEDYLKSNPILKPGSNPPQGSGDLSNWISLGTNSSTGGYAGVGRINCIAFHPTNNNIYWVGAASGGLWLTTNNGSSWACLTDNNGVLAVSDIIIPSDYASSNTIYIATGDRDHWDNRSIGVLKSTDGGSNWNTTGISFALSDGQMVNKLLIDPNNNQTLIAATTNGVYKTINGGTTWSTQLTTSNFIDLEYKPGDFNTFYGSTQDGKIYVTSNGGVLWTLAFSDANAYRVEIAVSAIQPTWVYAIAVANNNGLYGIYKSTNSGSIYSQVFAGSAKNLLAYESNGSGAGGQGWYDLCIAVSPTNASTLLVGGINTWRSTNDGTSWSIVNHWWGDGVPAVHADKHMLKYRNNGDLFECNDGGVYISTNNGTTWTDKTNGLVISQMYKLGVSQTISSEIITGLQDNGTKLLSGGSWSDVKGGDGMECLIDYNDVNIQYGTYVNGQIDRTTDHWNSVTNIQPSAAGDGAWVTPYIIDPNNSQTLYAGYADVWKTTNRGTSWTKISTINSVNKIRSMAIAPSNTQYLYVAELYNIWKTINGGISWTNITGTLPVGYGNITSIAVKNGDANTLWVTMSAYTANTVYQSIDGGTSWTNISAGLPQIPAFTIVQNKQSLTENQLYVGTELGIYFKKGINDWIAFNTGLPNVKIGEIEIYYAVNPQDSKLRAATYGRGLWESPIYYNSLPMTYVSSTTSQNNITTVVPNQTNLEIIGIQIVNNGDLSPLTSTSFTFNTTGSSDPSTDITNAKLYYTGGQSSFATTNQFGTTAISPNGTFNITGTQTLGGGTNYFWLTYDIPQTATIDNLLDAQCTSLTVVTAKTPTVANPSGNRKIALNYCSTGSPAISYEYISNVSIGAINQTSGRGTAGYQCFTSQITSLQIGVNTAATISVTDPYASDQVLIWIDWNKDGDFIDAGENVYSSSGSFTSPHTTSNFAPPVGTAIGITRMRIRLHDAGSGPNVTPCGNSSYGEVEDYSINVTSPCTPPPAPFIGTINQPTCALATGSVVLNGLPSSGTWILTRSPGGTTTTGTGTSTTISGLATGTYTYTVTIAAGCTSTASENIVINAQPPSSITVTSPNGAENWQVLTTKNITWNSSCTSGNVRIQYSTNNGAAWNDIVASTNDDGLYSWAIPNIPSLECLIRISNVDSNPVDESDAVFTISAKPVLHFTPVWTGNGFDHMNFYVLTATLDGIDLQPDDEIAIFDGDVCVGAGTLSIVLVNGLTYLSIAVSKDDPGTPEIDGYTPGHNATFKLWDNSLLAEISHVIPTYVAGSGTFEVGSSASLNLNGMSTLNQSITLNNGWNIFSLYVEPPVINMKTIVQPLIDAGYLVKVQDEAGAAIEYVVPIGWINNIGNWKPSEGYKIKVSTNTQLNVTGYPIANPFGIDLKTGWNIISYPVSTSQNAMGAVNPLITRGTLVKVQNESGLAIENVIPIGWIDNIHTFTPGDGYKVKVNANDQLIITKQTSKSLGSIAASSDYSSETMHFKSAWKGNGNDQMNVYITPELNNAFLALGDEIALFDGEACVGKSLIKDPTGIISIVASKDDPTTSETDGFIEGHAISFKVWTSGIEKEIQPGDVQYASGYSGKYEALGTTVVSFGKALGVEPNNCGPEISATIYPNPFDKKITIALKVNESKDLRIRIYNLLGEEIYSKLIEAIPGTNKLIWNGNNDNGEPVNWGVYFLKIISSDLKYMQTFEMIKNE